MFFESQLQVSSRPTKPTNGLQGIFTLGPAEYAPNRDTMEAMRRGGLMSGATSSLYAGLVRSGDEGASLRTSMKGFRIYKRGEELPGPIAVPLELIKDTRAFRPAGSKVTIEPGVDIYTDYIPQPLKYDKGQLLLETDIYQAIRAQDAFGTPLARTAGIREMQVAASEASAIKRLGDIDKDREYLETKQIPTLQRKVNKLIDQYNGAVRELESLTGQNVGTLDYVEIGINVTVMVLKFTPFAWVGAIIKVGMMIANAFDAFGKRKKKNRIRNVIDAMTGIQREIITHVGYLKGLVNKRNALASHAEALEAAFEAGPTAVKVKISPKRFFQKERILESRMTPFGLQVSPRIIERAAASGLKTTQRIMYIQGEDSPIVVMREAPKIAAEGQPITQKKVAVYGGILGELPRQRWDKSMEPAALALGY